MRSGGTGDVAEGEVLEGEGKTLEGVAKVLRRRVLRRPFGTASFRRAVTLLAWLAR